MILKQKIKDKQLEISHKCYDSDMLINLLKVQGVKEDITSVRELYVKTENKVDNRTEEEIIEDVLNDFKRYEEERAE